MTVEGGPLDVLPFVGHSDGPLARLVRLEHRREHPVVVVDGAVEHSPRGGVGPYVHLPIAPSAIAVNLRQRARPIMQLK